MTPWLLLLGGVDPENRRACLGDAHDSTIQLDAIATSDDRGVVVLDPLKATQRVSGSAGATLRGRGLM